MKKHIPLVVAAMALCLLPVLCLSPLLLGAGKKNCNLTPFNGACNYSAGCNLKIYLCSTFNGDEESCTNSKTVQTALAVNLFSCVAGAANQACDPVLKSDGTAATTDCVISYSCVYASGKCTQGPQSGTPCQAPYYQDDSCP